MKTTDSNYDLVLVTGDLHIPARVSTINEEIKNLLQLKKFQHVICTGNIGSKDALDFLKSLCNSSNFHLVKGDLATDEELENSLQETKTVKIGDFNISLINGFQLLPWSDIEALSSVQRQTGCDILVSGYTHKQEVINYEGKYFINPGSLTGAYSPLVNDPASGFMVLVISGDVCFLYQYEFNSTLKNFEVKKLEINKNKSES